MTIRLATIRLGKPVVLGKLVVHLDVNLVSGMRPRQVLPEVTFGAPVEFLAVHNPAFGARRPMVIPMVAGGLNRG